jgi:lipoprotein-releasing system permease protein
MRFELFIALRYLFTRRRHSFISVISLVSVLGVALGVGSLIVVLGVMNGFSNDLREKILGVNSHAIVMHLEGGMPEYEEQLRIVATTPGVEAVTPFIYSEVMLSTATGVKGVILRGIDPVTAGEVLNIGKSLEQGNLKNLSVNDNPPGIVVGRQLAHRLGLTLGSQVNLLSPAGRQSAAGFTPKVKPFEVVGVFNTGMFEYDTTLAFVSLDAARDLLGLKRVRATGLEVKVNDVYAAEEIGKAIVKRLGSGYYARNWMEMNANLFAALKLEKTAMFIILILIVLVGSFSIITTLVMMVMEKTKDIAVLMSMGSTRESIRRIFLLQGSIIGLVGTSLGYALGVPTCLLLKQYRFIKLPPDVYPLDHLPVRLEWLDLTVIGVVAMALCFVATMYPARQASRLKPAEALRFE